MLGYFLLGGYKTARLFATAQVRNLVHQARMGLAYGLTETISSTTMILSPILAGYLYTRNPLSIFSIAAILILLSLIASTIFLLKPGKRIRLIDQERSLSLKDTLSPTEGKHFN
jgi:MFS family permease